MAVDVFNTHAEDVCAICHEALSGSPTYTLPECQHTFHVHCIVAWFRHASTTSIDSQGRAVDAPCPYCMNRGINNGLDAEGSIAGAYGRYGIWTPRRREAFRMRERMLKAFLRSPGAAASEVKTVVESLLEALRKSRQNLADRRSRLAQLRKQLKEEPIPYNEANKLMRAARRKVWDANRDLSKKGVALLAIPVVPLIVPTPIDIN